MRARGSEVYPERDARVVTLRIQGVGYAGIRQATGLSRSATSHVLRKAEVVDAYATPEQRAAAVALSYSTTIAHAARAFRVSAASISRWRQAARAQQKDAA